MNNVIDKLRELDGNLRNLNDLSGLNRVISHKSASLFNALSDSIIFVSNESIIEVNRIVDRLGTGTGSLVSEINNEINNLVGDWNYLSNPAQKNNVKTKIDELNRISGGTTTTAGTPPVMTYTAGTGSANLSDRLTEYNNIKVCQNSFILGNNIGPYAHTVGTANNNVIDVTGTGFNCIPTNGFAFFDKDGKKISPVGGKYKFSMFMDDGTERDVEVEGISIDNSTPDPQIKFGSSVKFNPENIDYSKPLKVKLGGVYENVSNTGIHVVHTKELEINITNPNFLNSVGLRGSEFNNYNNSSAGGRIDNHLINRQNSDLHKLERESIERALKDGDGPKYEKLTPEQKEQFYQHIRNLNYPGTGTTFFEEIKPLLKINYNSFRAWFIGFNKDRNKDIKNIATRRKYNDFIHNNLESKSTEYINSRLDNFLISGPNNVNNFLKGELTTFFDEIEKQRIDNNMHDDVEADIADGKGGRHHLNKKRRSILGLFRLGRKDETPMRFFNGSKINIQNQKVNITTNNGPEDLNNKEPVEYGLDLEVSGKNKIEATITLEGEPPFTLKSGDPAALIRNVLRHQPIKYGKVRAHIAYNIIKGIIKMSNDIDMPLVYQYDTNKNREIKMDGDNIVLEEQDDTGSKRTTSKLFDYKLFEATNTFESTITDDNRSLRNGIDKLMGHMTCALNKRHNQFCKATEFRRNSTTNFPTSYRTSPLKKLLNIRTNTNFDFETTVQGKNGKNIQVKFSKNKFTLNYEGLKKPISSKSIGVLLNHVQGGSRVFDGAERDLCAGIYGEMIKKLRTNSKIAKTNFAVKDDVTGRTYVLDDDGKFGYISNKESARDGVKIKKKNWMNYATKGVTTGGLITGGFLTGGVGAVLNPLSWKGLATIPLFAGGALSAANLGFYGKKNFPTKDGGFDYGVIDQDPPGLVMCTESQTKELLKNPLLMGRMIKAMNDRLGNIHFK